MLLKACLPLIGLDQYCLPTIYMSGLSTRPWKTGQSKWCVPIRYQEEIPKNCDQIWFLSTKIITKLTNQSLPGLIYWHAPTCQQYNFLGNRLTDWWVQIITIIGIIIICLWLQPAITRVIIRKKKKHLD